MSLPFLFANVSTLVTSQLDSNYNALGALTPVPCTVAGTNTLTLTPAANTPTITAYSNYMQLTFVAGAANTTSVQAQVGTIPLLNVYKDAIGGPVLLSGGEIQPSDLIILIYDTALNGGSGGFHLFAMSALLLATGSTVTGGMVFGSGNSTALTNIVSLSSSISWASIPGTTSSVTTFLLGGCSVGDCVIFATPGSIPTGINFSGWVNAAGTVTLQASNSTGAALTPTAGNYRVTAQRYTP